MNAEGINPLDGHETIVMELTLARVFVLRIWLGIRILRLAMWVIGGRAEVLPQE